MRRLPFSGVLGASSSVTAASLAAARAAIYSGGNQPGKVTIGSVSNGLIPAVRVSWTDIAGTNTASNHRLAAGRLLSMMDMCAARAAGKVVSHVSKETGSKYLTATVGVTNTLFASAALHGDAIRMDGRVIHCGESSMGVYIRFYRQSSSTRMENPVGESFFTMVTMTPELKAAKVVPAMVLTDPFDIAMHKRYHAIRAMQKEYEADWAKVQAKTLTSEEVDCPINIGKPMHATIQSTRIEANRIFFSAYLNNNNTVFGGELMAWMEMHATHCARMFTGNHHVYTIGMHSVSFNEPVFATDWVTLHATVVYVRNTTMEVDVKISVERTGTNDVLTNRASFVLINENEIGQKANVPVGLALTNASQEELHAFLEARQRYHRSVERSQNFDEQMKKYALTKSRS